jgi:hypothetical protein
MKRFLLTVLLLIGRAVAADNFWAHLTPEERAAAGVADLTPGQREALDRLAGRFAREGALQATTAAVAQAREETKAKIEAEIRQREAERVGRDSDKLAPTTVSARLTGQFKGWNGRTLFRLDNGQVWVQADPSEIYWVPPQEGPPVEIRKAGVNGWKLFVLPNERWVRVKRVN